MPTLSPLEIKALARIIDELDYYQMMELEREATGAQLREAYYASARTFHPDANRGRDAETLADCSSVSKRITEGYCVLRNPRKRHAYDQKLSDEAGIRMPLSEAMAAAKSGGDEAKKPKTPQGLQFQQKATDAINQSDWATARGHLQMALTFEPNSEYFKEQLEEMKIKIEAARKAAKGL